MCTRSLLYLTTSSRKEVIVGRTLENGFS
jgi:hypothetical protein